MVGKSILNKANKADIGEICLGYGGDLYDRNRNLHPQQPDQGRLHLRGLDRHRT